jgi:glucosamine-6-phosphate isomerase
MNQLLHQRYPDYEAMSNATANIMAEALRQNPTLTLCMASGHTPSRTCDIFVRLLKEGNINYQQMRFIGLDEWVGLSPDNTGSCQYFFMEKLIKPLGLKPEQVFLFDALASDLQQECTKMDAVIQTYGIDMMVVGIGVNGHIGFNEPGTPVDILCHVATLEPTTVEVGQKYFTEATALGKGITVGLGHLMAAKRLVLIANGAHKKDVVQQARYGPVDPMFPASIIQVHPHVMVITDSLT